MTVVDIQKATKGLGPFTKFVSKLCICQHKVTKLNVWQWKQVGPLWPNAGIPELSSNWAVENHKSLCLSSSYMFKEQTAFSAPRSATSDGCKKNQDSCILDKSCKFKNFHFEMQGIGPRTFGQENLCPPAMEDRTFSSTQQCWKSCFAKNCMMKDILWWVTQPLTPSHDIQGTILRGEWPIIHCCLKFTEVACVSSGNCMWRFPSVGTQSKNSQVN